jgi:hypothetical protein
VGEAAQLDRGTVVQVTAGGAVVRLASGEVVKVRNGLNVRTPPLSQVLIATDAAGKRQIVSRPR